MACEIIQQNMRNSENFGHIVLGTVQQLMLIEWEIRIEKMTQSTEKNILKNASLFEKRKMVQLILLVLLSLMRFLPLKTETQ